MEKLLLIGRWKNKTNIKSHGGFVKMFNSYLDNKFNYNVNSVSGTLRKTMQDSKFIISKLDSDLYIFNPRYQSLYYNSAPITILQIMLIGDNKCLIEYVEKDIFDKIMSNSENDSIKQEENADATM